MSEPRRCGSCGHAAKSSAATRCPRCGHDFAIAPVPPESPVPRKISLRQGSTAQSGAAPAVAGRSPFQRTPAPRRHWRSTTDTPRSLFFWIGTAAAVACLALALSFVAISRRSVEADPSSIDVRIEDGTLFASAIYAAIGRSPVLIETGYTRGDLDAPFEIVVTPIRDDMRCEVEVVSDGLIQQGRWQGTLGRADRPHSVLPSIQWDREGLANRLEPGVADLLVGVTLDGTRTELRRTVRVRPIREANLGQSDSFAALVNEDHPWIDPLLREAIDLGALDSYDLIDEERYERVFQTVFAVWASMRNRGITYSSIGRTSMEGSQYVRSLDEIVRHRQANCADGSLAFASILRKLDIPAAIVLLPGHMLVAFRPCLNCRWVGLETTIIGRSDGPESIALDARGLEERYLSPGSPLADDWRTFAAAVQLGDQQLRETEEGSMTLVEIQPLRQAGILPAPVPSRLGPIPPVP